MWKGKRMIHNTYITINNGALVNVTNKEEQILRNTSFDTMFKHPTQDQLAMNEEPRLILEEIIDRRGTNSNNLAKFTQVTDY